MILIEILEQTAVTILLEYHNCHRTNFSKVLQNLEDAYYFFCSKADDERRGYFRIRIMFYVIGLGLGDAKDVTVKGLEIIKKCDRVYLESYTSILTVQQEALVLF